MLTSPDMVDSHGLPPHLHTFVHIYRYDQSIRYILYTYSHSIVNMWDMGQDTHPGLSFDIARPGNNQTSSKARGYNFVEVVSGAWEATWESRDLVGWY